MSQLYWQPQDTRQPMSGTTSWCSMKHCKAKRCTRADQSKSMPSFWRRDTSYPLQCQQKIAIISPDSEFTACLQSEGKIIFLNIWYSSQKYLEAHPHIKMTSRHHRNPHQIQFPQTRYGVQEEIEGRNVSATSI